MRVHVSEPCFIRLAYAYYPYLRVTVDGQSVTPYQTTGGFIALRLDAGAHRIALEPYLSPIRRALLAVDLVLVALAFALFLQSRHTRGEEPDQD
jgi:hypothetical protein